MAEIGIEVVVYGHSDPTVPLEVLSARITPSYLEELKGPGGGNIVLSIYDPKVSIDPTLVAYRNVLKIKVAGKVVGAMLVGKKTSVIIDSSSDAEVYQVSGEGLRTWLNGADVYPSGGLKKTSFDQRAFNFASEQGEWYDPDQWVLPTNVVAWGDVEGSPWRYAPANWPDVPLAQWVWSSDSKSSAPAGDNFFRYEFDVATEFTYSFFLAADDQYSVYIDGQLVSQSDPNTSAFTEVERIDTVLAVGHHVIGVRVTNNTEGPAAFIAALFYYGDPAVPSAATLVSYTGKAGDTAWKVAGYPDPLPGWSPGEIVHTLLEEAETRGVRFPLWLTPTFTATEDSYGNAWDRSLDWSFGVGDSLSSVIAKLEELVCDVWIDPDTLELNMAAERGVDRSVYQYDVDGITVVGSPILFEKGKNLGPSSIDGVSEIVNSLIVSTADGYLEVQDESDSISEYGRIEGLLDTGVSSGVSEAVADAVFTQKANPEEGASYTIIPIPGSIPFVDFAVGDWVLAPNALGVPVKRRVMSISVEEDEAGNPSYAVEFDTIFQDNDDKLNVWLAKLGGGALGGQFANSGNGSMSPIGQPVVTPPGTTPIILLPLAPTGLSSDSVGLWSANGVDAYSEVTIFWEAVTSNTDGSPTTPLLYEVWGHLTENSDNTYERFAVTTDNQATFRPFQTDSKWTFHVRALNAINAPGAYSDSIDVIMSAPNTPMLAPTTPSLSSNKGVLIVSWDGQLTGALDPPPQFRYVYAEVATSPGGAYTRMGTTLSRDGRNIYISGLVIGTAYWVKLIAVDGIGIESAASTAASITLTGIDLGDLDTSIGDAIDAAHQAGLQARSMNNMLNGGGFEENDPGLWSLETSDVTNQTTTPLSGLRALRIDASTSAFTASRYGLVLEVAPGESYQFGAWVRSFGSGTTEDNGLSLSVEYGADETVSDGEDDLAGSPSVTSTYEYFAGTWTVPAGVHFVKPALAMSDTGGTNSYLVDDLTFRMVIPNALIVNGAVTADKIGAGEVIAEKLAADSVSAEKIQAGAVVAGKIAAGAVTADTIGANAVTANAIAAGSITTLKLASEVGQELDISSNDAVNILVGQIDTVTSDQNATSESLETMQTYYQFGPDGAVISAPESPFAIHIANDRIEMLQLNVPVSYWNAGQMFVNSLVGTEVILGNHKIEKYGSGTVVRAL
jgi:hypothetical protein